MPRPRRLRVACAARFRPCIDIHKRCYDVLRFSGLQVGGGINTGNALSYTEKRAVIVTSYVFSDGKMNLERLKNLVHIIGRDRLVLDLSCRKKGMQINSWSMELTLREKNWVFTKS
ncbi:hypothetical protein MLD38_016112 [Melastoma candidum]|uniref:Uncharacterized protein n=1 Tax=Melastoma candidum TaxID=119954 RepID=A0ACB9RJN4_9MYRT|nr:hypothetical protein MLD38_016112 [Melastoma candidum]